MVENNTLLENVSTYTKDVGDTEFDRYVIPTVIVDGIPCYHIGDVSTLTGHSVVAFRMLISGKPTIRRMNAVRINSSLYIPIKELEGYPFTRKGASVQREIYHYKRIDEPVRVVGTEQCVPFHYEKCLCETCSYTSEHCQAAKDATSLNIAHDILEHVF